MQPKLTAKAVCADKEVGKISKVIVDPLSHEISHVVIREWNGEGTERQVPIGQVQEMVNEEEVILRCSSEDFARFPLLERSQYVGIKEVEIAHLEDHLHVEPGEILVPLPRLEQGVPPPNVLYQYDACDRNINCVALGISGVEIPHEANV
jgi:hypothetical protein